MGLNCELLSDLIALKRAGALDGATRVAEIGAQQLADTFLTSPDLPVIYGLFGRDPVSLGQPVGPENFTNNAPSSAAFWRSLGFNYSAIDMTGGADVIHMNLNLDSVSEDLRGAFDLVVNAGTTEHVANQDNAFRVIHDLARCGGVMLHQLPAQGLMGHALINYSPKFFWHLCRENGYEPLHLLVQCGEPCEVPQNVIDSNFRFGGTNNITEDLRRMRDFWISASLRKINGSPFVTPMDAPVSVPA